MMRGRSIGSMMRGRGTRSMVRGMAGKERRIEEGRRKGGTIVSIERRMSRA